MLPARRLLCCSSGMNSLSGTYAGHLAPISSRLPQRGVGVKPLPVSHAAFLLFPRTTEADSLASIPKALTSPPCSARIAQRLIRSQWRFTADQLMACLLAIASLQLLGIRFRHPLN